MAENTESEVLPKKKVLKKSVSSRGASRKRPRYNREETVPLARKRKVLQRKLKEVQSDSSSSSDSESDKKSAALQGANKSGRFWKSQKKRFRTVIKSPGLVNNTLEKRLALRADLKHAKELTRATVDQRKADKEAKKERRRENMRRAEINQKKAEIIQVIKNSAKVKKMKKKQLRYIEKRDTTKIK